MGVAPKKYDLSYFSELINCSSLTDKNNNQFIIVPEETLKSVISTNTTTLTSLQKANRFYNIFSTNIKYKCVLIYNRHLSYKKQDFAKHVLKENFKYTKSLYETLSRITCNNHAVGNSNPKTPIYIIYADSEFDFESAFDTLNKQIIKFVNHTNEDEFINNLFDDIYPEECVRFRTTKEMRRKEYIMKHHMNAGLISKQFTTSNKYLAQTCIKDLKEHIKALIDDGEYEYAKSVCDELKVLAKDSKIEAEIAKRFGQKTINWDS